MKSTRKPIIQTMIQPMKNVDEKYQATALPPETKQTKNFMTDLDQMIRSDSCTTYSGWIQLDQITRINHYDKYTLGLGNLPRLR